MKDGRCPSPPSAAPKNPDGDVASYAQVVVPVPVEGPFTYAVPARVAHLALPGMRVGVRFGGRRLTGTVVAMDASPPAGLSVKRIRPLDDCLDPLPLLSPLLLSLTRWLAETTLSSWGEAIRAALPGGLLAVGQRRVTLTREGALLPRDQGGTAAGPEERQRLLAALRQTAGGGLKLSTLKQRLRLKGLCAIVYQLASEGLVRVEDEWSEGIGGRWQRWVRPGRHLSLQEARQATARAPSQRRAVELLWGRGDGIALAELGRRAPCGAEALRALFKKGLIEGYRAPADEGRRSAWTGSADGAGSFELSAAQRQSLAAIEAALSSARPPPFLLHGVTGSGKTEVYLRAALAAVKKGRRAILMVPEIGLTPLLEHRARAALGDRVVVMHSGLSPGERLAAWWQARRGKVPVVIGPRSAVFAPLEKVGLMVIDEEQDGAYKQQESPRYHGRNVAIERARLEGAVAVLGSATPAMESFHHARQGIYGLLCLPDRVTARALPAVKLIDMRESWKQDRRAMLSRQLEEAVGDRLQRRQQALLLLNRRGFAAALMCRFCGERIPCPNCAVSLTHHRQRRQLRCHYCDYRMEVPCNCPHCGSQALHGLGYGTQRLQAALQERFPSARIRRFDADATRTRGAHARILSAFGRGELDILVGTQMLAKGHDFPGVTLVGVVGADAALDLPDFRAAEKTFQLLTQMAGRAGRGEIAGTVLLQAYKPDHYAIRAAVDHDYTGFYEHEIAYRRRLGYPPFSCLIACVCRGTALAVLKEEADCLAAVLRNEAGSEAQILGPASPALARLRGRHRLQLLLRGADRASLRQLLRRGLRECRRQGKLPRDLRIDVDPLNLM
ncbi:MAG: primosomal protein N' [Acidobacteriota bacterium]